MRQQIEERRIATNGVGQVLDQQLSHTLPGVNLVWSPAAASSDSDITNGLNRYTSVAGTALSYDGNGKLTSDLTGQSFTFDAENVLREVNGQKRRLNGLQDR